MSAVRRSSRQRRPVHSIYEEQARESLSSAASRSRKQKREQEFLESDHEEEESEHEEEVMKEILSSDEDEDSEADEQHIKELVQVHFDEDGDKKRKIKVRSTSSRGASKKSKKSALLGLAKKILHADETPENSLLAQLLLCCESKDTKRKAGRLTGGSLYAEELAMINRRFIQQYNEDINAAQVALFNLIFRSVGGSYQSLIKPEEADLENLTEEDWEDFVSSIIADMQDTTPDKILLSADPKVAQLTAPRKAKAKLGAFEYRQIYEEFWHELAALIMSDNVAAQRDISEGNASGNEEIAHPRFRVEMIRDIVARLVEIVAIGQSDIRMASTIAVYQIGIAAFEHTVALKAKVAVANRQLSVAQRSKMSRKAEMLTSQIRGWKRTIDDVESTVKETVLGVFVRRYRDSNCYIRAESLRVLSKLIVIRPDMFLVGAYLKYLAWMMSDKEPCVRIQAIQGLLAPFQQPDSAKIDTSPMTQVIEKFLPRLADCVIDINADVQEVAMELLLVLLREGFLDNLDDDRIWDQINLRAIAPAASNSLRRNALYFVLDQLEAFDSGTSSELRVAVEKINGLVNWMSHVLADSNIPVDSVKYELVDLLLYSLRSMPEHCSLATNWSALLSALEAETSNPVGSSRSNSTELRLETVRRRVILRMIVCAAELEIKSSKNEELKFIDLIDSDFVEARSSVFATDGQAKKTKGASPANLTEMTLELLTALPPLLDSFKGDNKVLRSLTKIPSYLVPSVLNLPSRKKDVVTLLSKLSDIFLVSVDLDVLQNCCLSLATLAQGEHARSADAKIALKKMASETRSKLETLYNDKTGSSGRRVSAAFDIRQGIGLCMKRLAVLSKRWYVADLLWDAVDDEAADDKMDELCTLIGEDLWSQLSRRKLTSKNPGGQDDHTKFEIEDIWKSTDARVHELVSDYVEEAFSFLLSSVAWRIDAEIKRIELSGEPDDLDVEKHIIHRMKIRLEKLILACFDMFIDPNNEAGISEQHKAFSTHVQASALTVGCDIRTLFPAQWCNSSSKLLSSLATTSNSLLEGCIIRYLKLQGPKIRANEELEIEDTTVVRSTLLPLARALTCNWKDGSRLEAAMMLRHILGSGQEAAKLVSSASGTMKKLDPIRLLESHMACLRVGYGDWEVAEPLEPESDRPSEEEMEQYEEAKREHEVMFDDLEQLAGRLSGCLGVGKIGDRKLESSLLGFLREGIRFAFDTNEDAPLGIRLPFLILVGKYLKWIRRNRSYVEIIQENLNKRERELRNDDEFHDVLESDLRAIELFRQDGNLGDYVGGGDDVYTEAGRTTRAGGSMAMSSRPRMSMGSSVSSIRSKITGQTTLTPVNEEDMTVEDDESTTSPRKRRKIHSTDGSISTNE